MPKNVGKSKPFTESKKNDYPSGSIFLGRVSFYAFKIDFRYLAVRKSIIFGVYWL